MASSKREKMGMDQVESAVQQWVSDAQTYLEAELSPDRANATSYYRGDPFGNEEAGRSQVILTDLRDTVLAMMPSFMRVFFGGEKTVEYQPRPKTEDKIQEVVAQAEQATEYVNAVVLQQDNDGFTEFYSWFKDALVRRLGVMKYWWDDQSQYKEYDAKNLDINQFEMMMADPDVEVTDVKEHIEGEVILRDISYKHWRKEGYAVIRCVPPEELLVSRDARSKADCAFMAHRTEKTRSELIAMGVPEKEIDEYGGMSSEVRQSIEEIARRGGISHTDQSPNEAGQRHLWIESYPYLDVDGDGEAELVRVRSIGPGCHVVGEPEPVDERPFAILSTDPEPHVLIGGSVADRIMDLQLIKSSVLRATLDSLSMSIFPRTFYQRGEVERQALESTAMGQNIPTEQPPSAVVMESKTVFAGQDALPVLSYLDQVKQSRVGPLPASLDPDALQSSTAGAVKATINAANDQLELIARIFAETGVKQLFRGLLKLLVENQPRARIVRLRNQFVPVDPRAWDANMDVSVNVALGSGLTEEKLAVLAATAADQQQIIMTLGPANPLCGLGQYRYTRAKMLELQGFKDTTKFYNALPADWQPPPQPPTPDPNLLYAQAEMAKAQAQIAREQADLAVQRLKLIQDQQELETAAQNRALELALKREEMHLTDERDRDKAEADVAIRIAIANAQFGSQITLAQIENDMELQKLEVQREQMANDLHTAHLTAQAKPAANGDSKPAPKKAKKGEKVTTLEYNTEGKVARMRTQEPD